MPLVHDMAVTVQAMPDTIFVTCSALISTAASTAPAFLFGSTADAVVDAAGTGTTGVGRVIDRLTQPLGTMYGVAMPSARIFSSRGSTEADRKMTLGIRLQHGDSSAGGDMADFSTAEAPAIRTWFGTARTTDQLNWDGSLSTGALNAATNPSYYDLKAAKRYIRAMVTVSKDRVTTESSGDEQCRVGAQVTFLGAAYIPQPTDVGSKASPFSTSTSTS